MKEYLVHLFLCIRHVAPCFCFSVLRQELGVLFAYQLCGLSNDGALLTNKNFVLSELYLVA